MNRLPTVDVRVAAGRLRAGKVIAFPTETVYGLGADAANAGAVREVFRLKGRPHDHPLIVHLAAVEQLSHWATDIPDGAYVLAERFWPGPLTLVLPRGRKACDQVTGGQETVALRVPAHPLALELLREFGGGLAAPSANRFGRVSPTTAEHVRLEFGPAIETVLDGGPCSVGVESTILSLAGPEPILLRPGGVAVSDLEKQLGHPVLRTPPSDSVIRAPGMLAAHYAPATPLQIVPAAFIREAAETLATQGQRIATMAIGTALSCTGATIMPSDPADYARELYAALRQLDAAGFDRILAEAPPREEAWLTVNDRLTRAAANKGKQVLSTAHCPKEKEAIRTKGEDY